MATAIDWEKILDGRYPSYKVEVVAYLASLDIATSTDVSMQVIYDAIKNDLQVCENLKLLYKEALFGTEKSVRLRIKNRIGNFRRGLR